MSLGTTFKRSTQLMAASLVALLTISTVTVMPSSAFADDEKKDLAAPFEVVSLFKFVRGVTACTDAGEGGVHIQVHDEKQIRTWREEFVFPADFLRVESTRTLIRHGGEIVTIQDHDFSLRQ